MTVQVPGAAACQLQFAYLGLAKDEAMYLRAGETAHGPYLGHGPVNRPDFVSQWLPGDTFVITATGRPTADFPFVLDTVRCQTAEQLEAAPMKFLRSYTPSPGATVGDEVLAMVDDNLVRATRQNGATVLQGDIVLPEDAPAAGKNANRESMQVVGASRAWSKFRIPYVIGILGYEEWSEYPTINAIKYWNSLFPGILVRVPRRPITSLSKRPMESASPPSAAPEAISTSNSTPPAAKSPSVTKSDMSSDSGTSRCARIAMTSSRSTSTTSKPTKHPTS